MNDNNIVCSAGVLSLFVNQTEKNQLCVVQRSAVGRSAGIHHAYNVVNKQLATIMAETLELSNVIFTIACYTKTMYRWHDMQIC